MIRALSLLTALVATPALAQNPLADAQATTPADESQTVVYKKVTEYDFEGDDVEGRTLIPEGVFTSSRGGDRHRSLIRIRTNFVPALLASAEDL